MILVTINHVTSNSEDKYYLRTKTEQGGIICDISLSDSPITRFVYLDIIDVLKRYYKFSRIDLRIKNEEIDFYDDAF
ncbi:MAG: hypothetical protein JXN10_05455 [Clostridia bacterium]|nr:hypothetical protein [Clostridia bacterium]